MSNVEERRWTISVPEAARKYYGIKSKDAAYAAARAGTIPIIRVGRLLRVPVAALERFLEEGGRRDS
jgi:excisionase family DNA binding protein